MMAHREEQRYSSTHSLPWHQTEVKWSTSHPGHLTPGKNLGKLQRRLWRHSQNGRFETERNLLHLLKFEQGLPAHSLVIILPILSPLPPRNRLGIFVKSPDIWQGREKTEKQHHEDFLHSLSSTIRGLDGSGIQHTWADIKHTWKFSQKHERNRRRQ